MRCLRVAIVQTSAGRDEPRNLRRVTDLLADVTDADLIVTPEVVGFRGTEADYRRLAQPLDGSIVRHMAGLATAKNAWFLVGSLPEQSGGNVFNTSVLLDRSGTIRATYRKIHLFEAHLEDGTQIRESDAFDAGSEPVMAEIEGWKIGLAICYDLRFPELFRRFTEQGVQAFLIPSNFTQRTGRDHWEVLLRSRAIENQCFVVAPGQCGTNEVTGVTSYGNSMAVGPWGDILCRASDEEGVLTVELDPAETEAIRQRIPVLKHRRLTP